MSRCLLYALLALVGAGCAESSHINTPALPAVDHLLTGTWTLESLEEHWTITRRADHTFSEDRYISYPTPNTHLSGSGTWRVGGDGYCLTYLHITGPAFSQKLIGRTICARIYQITDSRFTFQFEDAMKSTEIKASSATQ
jgi:hypothetical protein